MPPDPWVMTQTWHDLLFAHWPFEPEQLAPRIPAGLELDTFDGRAWLAIVPFVMTNVAPRGAPALPFVSAFPELNVRTYVRAGGKPGVFFFSLDAARTLAVWTARLMFRLPYCRAEMTVTRRGAEISYRSRRLGPDRTAEFFAVYRPTGSPFRPQPGTLEHFLTERYCLYAYGHGGLPYRLEIHHPPWTLQPAEALISLNSMAAASGLTLPSSEPLLHFSLRQDVVAWRPATVEQRGV